ncbi:MAG: hypothetical protein WAZ94_12040 [Phycisphaerales bacterium]
MPLPPDIIAYHKAQSPSDRAICEVLAGAIDGHFFGKKPVAGAECKVWHRHPVWFIDGNPIVGYHNLKGGGKGAGKDSGCIRLMFWSGKSFDEPGLPADPPKSKFKAAAARFTSPDDISAKDLKRWLKKGVEIQWDYKNIMKRKGKLVRLK